MNDQIALVRPPPITRSAYICALVALVLLAYGFHHMSDGGAVGYSGMAAFVLSANGILCAYLLLAVNRFARLSFAIFWIVLVSAAGYSWAVRRATYDYVGVIGIGCLAFFGLGVWDAINSSWPRSGARSNTSLERTREG